MPNHGPILFHLLCLPVAFFSIYFSHLLSKRHRHPFLTPFFYFVVLDSLTTMTDVFFRILPVQLQRSGLFPGLAPFSSPLLFLFSLPFSALMLYYFVVSASKLFGFDLRPWFVISFWSIQLIIFTFSTAALIRAVSQAKNVLPAILLQVTGIVSLIYLFGSLFMGIRPIIKEKVPEVRTFKIVFCLSYFTFYIFQTLLHFLPLYGVWVTFLVFSIHIPVLASLPRFLAKTGQNMTRNAQPSSDVIGLYKEKGVSKREQEIITYIIAGLSNRDIEDKLFISRRTVENHVYKIFRKLNVKNRIQLLGLVGGRSNHEQPSE